METPTRIKILIGGLGATLVVAVSLLIAAAGGKQAAETSWSELYDLTQNPHPGMYVPVYEAVSSSGDTVRIGQANPGGRQLLYFFTTTCPYCRASVPNWKELSGTAASRPDVEVYGVAIDSTHLVTAYSQEHDLTYPVVEMDDRRFARLFRVTGVPLTMVVEPNGQVAYARTGEFTDQALMDSVRAVLDAPLVDPVEALPVVPSVGVVRAGR